MQIVFPIAVELQCHTCTGQLWAVSRMKTVRVWMSPEDLLAGTRQQKAVFWSCAGVPIRLSLYTRHTDTLHKYSDQLHFRAVGYPFERLPRPFTLLYHPLKMMFTKSLMSSFFALMSLLALAMSIPVQKRDVFVPPVVYPHQGTVWYAGQQQAVVWDTSNAPANITNSEGIIYLVVDNLIDFDYELASNFNILDGKVQVVVPTVSTGTYAIVLFGDSGNFSQNFTIVAS